MKNQYIGDIGDYGKYGMLRMLESTDLSIGVNWYLTPNDTRNDGNLNTYLSSGKYRNCDPELFDYLKEIAFEKDKSVSTLEQKKILGDNVEFYSELLSFTDELSFEKRKEIRRDWHQQALKNMENVDIVFIDPDNGVEVKSCSITSKNGNRYIAKRELRDYILNGKSCIVYNHRKRMPEAEIFSEYQKLVEEIGNGEQTLSVLSYLRGTRRDYLVIMQKEHINELQKWLEKVVGGCWGEHFVLSHLIQ